MSKQSDQLKQEAIQDAMTRQMEAYAELEQAEKIYDGARERRKLATDEWDRACRSIIQAQTADYSEYLASAETER